MEFGPGRKRGKPEAAFNGNGGFKKFKHEMESFPTGTGSKSKPCTKFFSTTGCQFGEGCHFSHYVPGGIKVVTQILGSNPALPSAARNPVPPQPFPEGPSPPTVKTRMCNKYNTAEGCRFGDKCHFAHGEWELGKPTIPSYEGPRGMTVRPPMGGGRLSRRMEPPPASSFGASATAKISVDASLAGAIIGKGGVNSKQICRVTGAKLSIRDHESDPNLKNIELEGSFDQIKQASAMVREIIVNIGGSASGPPPPMAKNPPAGPGSGSVSGFKTKLCEKFAKGTCTFGDRCHYAHGTDELRT
ncbi:zinc finger CCCH domain-containing protein 14-like [Rhododendron vialii]|uniref:zinc finger CCCH domain-containing protein 14-like n=1 Tax=Rhododendron vialii TaxID=182163 RepID=UPI00265F77E2|nr:zinc finger CCCH domain-containing protein 14-like [Rhododendron vialii]